MAFLDETKISIDIQNLLHYFETSQWTHRPNFEDIHRLNMLTRDDLRKIEMTGDLGHSKTSGSTGEPVTVGKTYKDYIWYNAVSIREFRWLGFDVRKNIAVIKPGLEEVEYTNWGIPHTIEPIQGKKFTNNVLPIGELQKWLEEKNPHYIHCFPSIYKQLDTSKISNFIDWKGTGEVGGLCYSSEECGIIALRCPDNHKVFHVMENQIVERDVDGSIIITTLSNKYIRRYKHGDQIELGKCNCGRTLQTITDIKGRIRNMMTLPSGDKKWPLIGSQEFETFGIKRFKMIQKTVKDFELSIICDNLGERETELKSLVEEKIGFKINLTIKYVDEFLNYKFEEFISFV